MPAVESVAPRRDHHAQQEHAEVQPGALAQVPFDAEEHADRRSEELVVLRVLSAHRVGIALSDAKQPVQRPAQSPAQAQVGVAPVRGVVDVLLRVPFTARIMQLRQLGTEAVSHRAGAGMNPPRLRVRRARPS